MISCSALSYIWALLKGSVNTCQSHKSWFIVLKQQGWQFPSLETFLLSPAGRSRRCLENITTVRGNQKLPPFLMFSRCENTFIPPCQCQISQQLRSFGSTFLSPSTGQVHIPWQLYLRPNTKKITHISKPDMVGSWSCSKLAGNLLHMWDPVSCEYTTQQVGIATSSNYNYLHCFERWEGPNY